MPNPKFGMTSPAIDSTTDTTTPNAEVAASRAIEKLHAKIGQLTIENDFFCHEVWQVSAPDRRVKLDRGHPRLSIRRQCEMLGVARSGVYRQHRTANDNDLDLMRRS